MKIALIASSLDQASMNIVHHLLPFAQNMEEGTLPFPYQRYLLHETPLYIFHHEIVFLEGIDAMIDADLFVFLSKHQSKNPLPCLTVHSVGNFATADLGGNEKTLVPSSPKALLLGLQLQTTKAKTLGFEAFQEATHHGPWLKKPIVFFEIGSTEKEWNNPTAGKAVAENILTFLEKIQQPLAYKVAIGIGGLHNAVGFRRMSLEQHFAFSHILPKYMLEHFSPALVEEMIKKTIEPVTHIVLDWKSLGKEKHAVLALLEKEGYLERYVLIKRK